MSDLRKVAELGQSFWLDELSKKVLSNDLPEFIDQGVTGLTSNPSIFEKAIASGDYDSDISALIGIDAERAYRELLFSDITRACDLLYPVFERTWGRDGYVSIEVPPKYAHDTEMTVAEAVMWSEAIGRQNLMIKVPGTKAGIEAVRLLTGVGININVTLLFSPQQYEDAANAFIDGLRTLASRGRRFSDVHSVASFFVSRLDTKVDALLDKMSEREPEVKSLRGTAALAVSTVSFARFQEIFSSHAFSDLEEQGANAQRLLFGSTSAKDPSFSPLKYVEGLIGPNTVNTLPGDTIRAFIKDGVAETALKTENLAKAQDVLQKLAEAEIDLPGIFVELEKEGVEAFDRSYWSVVEAIKER